MSTPDATTDWIAAPGPGEVVRCRAGDVPVAVWNVEAALYAVGDVCPHHGWILSEGSLVRDRRGEIAVVCPGHHWRFRLRDGESAFTPDCLPTWDVQTGPDGRIRLHARADDVPGNDLAPTD